MKKLWIMFSFLFLLFAAVACTPSAVRNAPTFSGVEDINVLQGSTFDALEGVRATDHDGNDITADIEVDGFVNTLILGEFALTYTVTDSEGLTATAQRFITVIFETAAPYALYNGDFSLGTGGWNLDTPGGQATFDVVDDMLQATITNPGTQWWQIQVHQTVSIEEGVAYRLNVEAMSPEGKRLGIGVEDTGAGFAMIPGGNVAFDLTDTLETYSFVLVSDRTIDTAKVVLYLGQIGLEDAGDIYINNVSVEQVELDDTEISIEGIEDVTLIVGMDFDPLEGVTALDQEGLDITDAIQLVGLVETNVANAQAFILQYVVHAQGETLYANRRVQVVLPIENPAEMFNPDFTMGLTGWTIDFPEGQGSSGSMVVVDGVVEANLTALGSAWWHIQLSQAGLHLTEGRSYEVTIVARADDPKRIGLGVEDTADGFRSQLPGPAEWDLTEEFQTFTYVFTAPRSITTAKYAIFMGSMAGTDVPTTVYVDKFDVRELEDAFPTLSGVGNVRIEEGTPFDPLEGVTADDLEDGDLTAEIEVVGTVDVNTVGVYELVYSVTDSSGNTTTATRVVTIVEATEGGMSVVVNPDFASEEGWNFDFPVGQGTMAYDEGNVRINLTDLGDAFWHIQLQQDGISIQEGKAYLISVRMMTDTPRTIGLAVEDAADGFANLAGEPVNFYVDETWTTYYYVFRASRSSDNFKLGLFLGQIDSEDAPGEILVSSFDMIEADEQNIMANSNFEEDAVWQYDFPVGEGTMNAVDNQLVADLTSIGDAWWHVQLYQYDRSIDTDVRYLITFRAASTEPRRIGLALEDPADGWRDLKDGVPVEWDLTTEMRTYTYIFHSDTTIDTAKIGLFFGFHTEGDGPSVITVENYMVIRLYDEE